MVSISYEFEFQDTGRIFKIGERLMEMPYEVVSKLNQWNRTESLHDNNFVACALLCFTEPEKLIAYDVPKAVTDFVYGMSKF